MLRFTKSCSRCGKRKDVDRFTTNPNTPDGLAYRCKQCINKRNRELYRRNIVKERARSASRRASEDYKAYRRKMAEDPLFKAKRIVRQRIYRSEFPEKRAALRKAYKARRRARENALKRASALPAFHRVAVR